ncbi:MAG: DUF4004 family protein [Clostridiaceae bacterium]|jgi:DNA-binding transcriptional MerR regulator|nr:DUF4004 family protein [Clostridiaceae bacterium]
MQFEISKKDLLRETGISYGQLYRWKRQNLIPEEWFIRRASYTGQETFFPKDKVLERVKTIQHLKDRYSLDELARMLSPEIAGINYPVERVLGKEIMDQPTADLFRDKIGKEFCTFWELCLIYTLGLLRSKYLLHETDLKRISHKLPEWSDNLGKGSYKIYVVKYDGFNSVILAAKEPPLLLDRAFQVMASYDLEEIGTTVKQKLSKMGL